MTSTPNQSGETAHTLEGRLRALIALGDTRRLDDSEEPAILIEDLLALLPGDYARAEIGLEDRFKVERLTPSSRGINHADCRYFVLDPQHDDVARDALAEYARRTSNADLRRDLFQWIGLLDGGGVGEIRGDSEATEAARSAWERCAKEAHALGWLHDWALSDLLARNPHKCLSRPGEST